MTTLKEYLKKYKWLVVAYTIYIGIASILVVENADWAMNRGIQYWTYHFWCWEIFACISIPLGLYLFYGLYLS